jgi:surface carbohydrate biosynthesis protein
MTMRIALILDNPFRDLPGLVLLGRRLCQEGAVVYLVPSNLQDRELWPLAPDYVLLNHLWTVNREFVHHAMEAGIRVGVLDTEGGVMTSPDVFAQTLVADASLRQGVVDQLSWGTRLAEHMAARGWYRPDQIAVTGHPRFDYYVEPYRRAALALSSYADAYARPMVLINGAFPMANPQFKTPEGEARLLVERYGFDPVEVHRWQEDQRETMRQMVALTNELASRYPGITFVYRPHPFEKQETYAALFDRRENLHCVKRGTADGWILRSAAVIQRSCSTAVEAGLAGVPALSTAWMPVAAEQPAAEAVSIQCHCRDELFARVAEAVESRLEVPPEVRSNLDEVIREWFYRIDGLSHERAAQRILDSLRRRNGRVDLGSCRREMYEVGRHRASLRARVVSRVKETLGIPLTWSLRQWRHVVPQGKWQRTEKYYSVADVQAVMDAVDDCELASKASGRVGTASSDERGDYHFGHKQGQSVTLFPA